MSSAAELFQRARKLHEVGKLADALGLYLQAVQADPRHAQAWHQLGCIAAHGGKVELAIEHFVRAIRLDGGQARFHNNLGECLRALNKLREAQASFEQAIRLNPDYVTPRINLGLTLYARGERGEFARLANEALQIAPHTFEEHSLASTLRLLCGDFVQGWQQHEWRLGVLGQERPAHAGAKWDGRPLSGETVLVYAEQGLGDTLQFLRYLPLLATRGGQPVLRVQRHMFPLLAESGFCDLVGYDEQPPECAFQCSLNSLPWAFGTTLPSIPRDVPYLRAKPALVSEWRDRLADVRGVRVGIRWQGNPAYNLDRLRSFALREFAPLARLGGVRLISLQKDAGREQLQALGGALDVVDLGDFDTATGAFMDTAAVMQNLDLVITSDTVIAHLAGALGVPVWVVLAIVPDWRWMLERTDSPWYPTMRLFRQSRAGDWGEVFARIADALAAEIAAGPRRAP